MVATVLPTPKDETPQPAPTPEPVPGPLEPPPIDRMCVTRRAAVAQEPQPQPSAWQRVIEKLTSGRWLLTIACALVFAVCAIRGTIETDAVVALIGAVFVSYFQRNDRNGNDQ
jgi:hypothetical protein